MKLFELTLPGMVVRFYLMMAVVITAGFTGIWALAILALPIFLSGMVGLAFGQHKKSTAAATTTVQQVEFEVLRHEAAPQAA